MSKLRLQMMMSLDSFTAAPEQSAENPLRSDIGRGSVQRPPLRY